MPLLTDEALPGSQTINLYRRTYTTILRSRGEVRLRAFDAAHREARPSLHADAADQRPDPGALIYAVNRLPKVANCVDHIWLAQMPEQVVRATGQSVEGWERVRAPARRRAWYYDGARTLAVYIASPSDLDDMVPTLVAYQIEWNKLHDRLSTAPALRDRVLEAGSCTPDLLEELAAALDVPPADWARLLRAWDEAVWETVRRIAAAPKDLGIRLIGGTHTAYAKLVRRWSGPIAQHLAERGLVQRPIYFISSNTHGLVNLLSGYSLRQAAQLEDFLRTTRDGEAAELREAWHYSNRENLLYYVDRLWTRRHPDPQARIRDRTAEEEAVGIRRIPAQIGLDVDAQVIELDRLRPDRCDPRLADIAPALRDSGAVIVNIDYPLGLAAYRILREVAEICDRLVGVYVVGKAATLNGDVGDILISDVVFDEHSSNTYSFPNAFRYDDVAPYLACGSVLDNQKAVTVRGTFLQNRDYLEVFYREHYTVVEMEAGPYLSAVYEASYPTRHPVGEAVHFRELPFDLGIIHYASDTPYTRARTLGGQSLSFEGIDSTYAAIIAVVRRIARQTGRSEKVQTNV
ncbi:MAG TPA: hypothetical protein VHL09_13380 [Dehalococcoidia bacterium]|nr:hypothetical protein [Dehalococcoidia bacterium]